MKAPMIVNVELERVTGPVTEYFTGRPEIAVGVRANGAAPYVLPGSALKLIVSARSVPIALLLPQPPFESATCNSH